MAKKFNIKRIMSKVGGAAAGGAVAQVSNKVLGNFNPKISAGAKIAAGALLPELMPKSAFVGEMGSGMIGVGAAELLRDMVPSLSGIGEEFDNSLGAVEEYTFDEMAGIEGLEGIGADDDNAIGSIDGEDDGTY